METGSDTPLRSMRIASGLTIRQLERATGINRGRLSILERGVPPKPDEIGKITSAFTAALRHGSHCLVDGVLTCGWPEFHVGPSQ
jgi:transcriptional regulator with XRE-family HTH domain